MVRPSIDLGERAGVVGDAVKARREALGYSRAEFARLWPTVSYRALQDLENANRDRFSSEVVAKLEVKLRWRRGSIAAMAQGEDPVEVPAEEFVERRREGAVESRTYRAESVELVQHIVRDVEEDIRSDADLTDEEADDLLERALEQARTQALMLVHMERARRRRDQGE